MDTLLQDLAQGKAVFKDVLAHIDARYTHTPTAFRNGSQQNAATENQGSAKVFTFAKLHDFSKEDTLKLFGEHYDHVLDTPEASNHQNIRQFMINGWEGVHFEGVALTPIV